jgi:hypothetical protein
MRRTRLALLLILALISQFTLAQQTSAPPATQTPLRDPQALSLLQGAIVGMGGSVPNDSVATATVVIQAGSSTQNGTAQFLTRGADQSSEEIVTADSDRTLIYSRDLGAEQSQGILQVSPLELVSTRQSPIFPLPLLANILNNQDSTLQYVGLETIDGASYQHIRTWNTYASTADRQPLSEFTVRDIWLNASSGLPWRISYNLRAGRGSPPRQPIQVTYGDFRRVGGILFPYLTLRSLNGTPWMTIVIQKVQLNTGLTDANFPVCGGTQ